MAVALATCAQRLLSDTSFTLLAKFHPERGSFHA